MIYLEVHSMYTYAYNVLYGSTVESAIQAQTFYVTTGTDDGWFMPGGQEQLFLRHVDAMGRYCHRVMTGLLHRVMTVLGSINTPYEIINMIPKWERDPKMAYLQDAPLSVRPYQVSGAMSLVLHNLPRKGGVLQIATGGGKTRTAAKTIQLFQVATVFLVDQVDLMVQTIEEFEAMLGCKVGQVGGGKCDIQDITVCTIQTVALAAGASGEASAEDRKLDPAKLAEVLHMMQHAKLIIVDECHGVAARTAQAAVLLAESAVGVVGLSATPWRDDGMDILIESAVGNVTFTISASELIRLGWLVRPEILCHNMPMPVDHLLRNNDATEFHKMYQDWVVNDPMRNGYIKALSDSHTQHGLIGIILVRYVPHGKILQEMIPNSLFLHGKVSKKKRKEILNDVKTGRTQVLIATSLADKGLDLPTAAFLILAGGGKSSTKALQRIGRVLRTTDGKNVFAPDYSGKLVAYVHDIVDQHANLQRHSRERVRIYKTEPAFVIRQHQVA